MLTCVDPHVHFEASFSSKAKVANMTDERFRLSSQVRFVVRIQRRFHRKSPFAKIAFVRPLARMDSDVPNKVRRFPETLRAKFAPVRVHRTIFGHFVRILQEGNLVISKLF